VASAHRDMIRLYMEHSNEYLRASELLIQSGMLLPGISNCYYAVFYAASAMLLTKGIERSRHSGVQAALNEFLIKPGELNVELGKTFALLRQERESADYDMQYIPGEEVAQHRLKSARQFVVAAQNYLQERGFSYGEQGA